MVALTTRFTKFYSRMGDHLHHHPPNHRPPSHSLPSLLDGFEADVSQRFRRLFSDTEPGVTTGKVSLLCIRRCLEMLPHMNGAFTKLVASVDHPMSAWGPGLAEDYLSYTLSLLEHLNRISSSISHLGHARVSLAHALSVSEASPSGSLERLKAIWAPASGKDCVKGDGNGEHAAERIGSGKESIIGKALNFMKGIEFWVCGIVLSALSGDASPYLEMRTSAARFLSPSMVDLDAEVYRAIVEEGISLEEVTEINDSVACIVDSNAAAADGKGRIEAGVLHSRLDGIEMLMEGLRREVDCLFSDVLAGRNRLLDCFRAGHC